MNTKRCSKCGDVKPLADFWRNLSAGDGLCSWCKACGSERGQQQYAAQKATVLTHYSTFCACCETTHDLAIDHVNGDGRKHRQALSDPGRIGYDIGDLNSATMYDWLIRNGFPKGFQTLCRPCNSSKGSGERCRIDHTRPNPRTRKAKEN